MNGERRQSFSPFALCGQAQNDLQKPETCDRIFPVSLLKKKRYKHDIKGKKREDAGSWKRDNNDHQ